MRHSLPQLDRLFLEHEVHDVAFEYGPKPRSAEHAYPRPAAMPEGIGDDEDIPFQDALRPGVLPPLRAASAHSSGPCEPSHASSGEPPMPRRHRVAPRPGPMKRPRYAASCPRPCRAALDGHRARGAEKLGISGLRRSEQRGIRGLVGCASGGQGAEKRSGGSRPRAGSSGARAAAAASTGTLRGPGSSRSPASRRTGCTPKTWASILRQAGLRDET